ncbi:MAG: hypothetical protein OEU33_10880, partial [Chromatiales bacterium]|nr:hypothetical protein [Chromatiales bacterium]
RCGSFANPGQLPGQRFAHCCGRHAQSVIRQENSAVKFKPDCQMMTAAAAALMSVCAMALCFSEPGLVRPGQ